MCYSHSCHCAVAATVATTTPAAPAAAAAADGTRILHACTAPVLLYDTTCYAMYACRSGDMPHYATCTAHVLLSMYSFIYGCMAHPRMHACRSGDNRFVVLCLPKALPGPTWGSGRTTSPKPRGHSSSWPCLFVGDSHGLRCMQPPYRLAHSEDEVQGGGGAVRDTTPCHAIPCWAMLGHAMPCRAGQYFGVQ